MKNVIRSNQSLFPSIPSLFEEFFNRDWLDSSLSTWKTTGATLPAVNVRETNDHFLIEVAAPGMKRDNFKVELQNNMLTISSEAEEHSEEQDNDGNYTRKEFSYQSFQRSFALPENKVEGDRISAKYKDGILHVSVPKREEAKIKPPKQITVA
jgi:HSP20 family protein